MINFYRKKTWLTLMLLCMVSSIFAGNQFIPKTYSFTDIAKTSKLTLNLSMTDIFEYPDGIDKSANLDDLGVTVKIESSDTEISDLYKYEYYNYGKVQTLYLWLMPNKAGDADVKITLTYQGETIENTIHISLKKVLAKDDSFVVEPKGELTADVLKNDQWMNNSDMKTARITIDEQPQYGTATVVSGTSYPVINYVPDTKADNYTFDRLKYTVTLATGEKSSATAKINIHLNPYASKILGYLPAPGQFTNTMNDPTVILGTQGGMVSLGAFGGYVILGFDQPIKNDPRNPYGVDFTLKGNSFIANLYGVWSEPGAVQVMKDVNNNGIPDDGEWYELAGSDYWLSTTKRNVEMTYYNPSYNKRYTVPWTTNQGESGAVLTNQFHNQSYYPDPYTYECGRDQVTFSGNVIRSSIDMSSPSYIEFYRAPAFGYCDNRGYDKTDLTVAHNPYYNDENGNATDGFDLSWAVDKNGNHVELDQVDFVKVYCAGSANAGWLGEWSTEVLGAAITTPDPDYVPQDYYLNYIGITQLQVIEGQTCQYEGFLFKNGRPVKEGTQRWWLSDNTVGNIDDTGKFTATKEGETWIYFSQKDDIAKDSIQISVVKLKKVVIDLEGNASTVSNDSTTMIVNETIYINAQCEDSRDENLNGNTANRYIYETFDWTTSNPEIGTIKNGSFTADKVGRTKVIVRSTSDPTLSDTILVIVKDIPEIKPVNSPIRIAYDKPEGEFSNSELFTTGNDATVYMEEVTAVNGKVQVSLEKNVLKYSFNTGEYCNDILRFRITCYKQEKTIEIPIIYAPDNEGMSKHILFTDNNGNGNSSIMGYQVNTKETKTLLSNIQADSISNMLNDGAFVYVSAGNTISRYNITTGELVASASLKSKAKHQLALYKNMLLVTDANGDNTDLKIYYKTDLKPVDTVSIKDIAKVLTVVDNNAYIITNDAAMKSSNLATIDLNTFEISLQELKEKALNVSVITVKDNIIYAISGCNDYFDCNIFSYNISNKTISSDSWGTEYPMFPASPVALTPLSGDFIMLVSGNAFVKYNITTKEIEDGRFMELGYDLFPMGSVYDAEENKYYVAYCSEDGTQQKAAIFDNQFNKLEEIENIGTHPQMMSILSTIDDNDMPTVSSNKSNLSCYERATSASKLSINKQWFTDRENNFSIYTRDLNEHSDWLSLDNTFISTNGNLQLLAQYTGDVTADSIATISIEAIDHLGYSVTRDVEITIKPRIYMPVSIAKDVEAIQDAEDMLIPVKSIFSYPGSSTFGLTFMTTVEANDNEDLVSATIENDNLVLSFGENKFGKAQIKLHQTVSHQTYGEKFCETEFTVNVKEKPVVSIEDTSNDIISIYPNPATDYIYVNTKVNAQIEIFNIDGQLVKSINISSSKEPINIQDLTAGNYLVRITTEKEVLSSRLIKK